MLGIQDGGKKDKKQENSRLQIQQVQTADSRGLLRDCEIFVILRISYVSSSNKKVSCPDQGAQNAAHVAGWAGVSVAWHCLKSPFYV